MLWQDPDAHVRGQRAVGEGENLSGLNPGRTRCLSDEVLTYTPSRKVKKDLHAERVYRSTWKLVIKVFVNGTVRSIEEILFTEATVLFQPGVWKVRA